VFKSSKHALTIVNSNATLHVAIEFSGVKAGEDFVAQALTFIARVMLLVMQGLNHYLLMWISTRYALALKL
jgi:dTDP-4-amino-4,6-dideoxygalactose transaminase